MDILQKVDSDGPNILREHPRGQGTVISPVGMWASPAVLGPQAFIRASSVMPTAAPDFRATQLVLVFREVEKTCQFKQVET